jgi:hypothetical protein
MSIRVKGEFDAKLAQRIKLFRSILSSFVYSSVWAAPSKRWLLAVEADVFARPLDEARTTSTAIESSTYRRSTTKGGPASCAMR